MGATGGQGPVGLMGPEPPPGPPGVRGPGTSRRAEAARRNWHARSSCSCACRLVKHRYQSRKRPTCGWGHHPGDAWEYGPGFIRVGWRWPVANGVQSGSCADPCQQAGLHGVQDGRHVAATHVCKPEDIDAADAASRCCRHCAGVGRTWNSGKKIKNQLTFLYR